MNNNVIVTQDQLNAEANTVKPTVTQMENISKENKVEIDHNLVKTFDTNTPRAIPTVIKFSSRASVKITHNGQDHYYTVEYGEERQIQNFNDVNIDKERQFLIDKCNNIVDDQIVEITKTFLK